QQYANFDQQQLPQMAIDQLVAEKLLDEAVRKTGLRASSESLRFYVMDNPVNPRIQDIIRQLNASGLSVSTPAQAYEIIFNPTRNGLKESDMQGFQRVWIAMEEETKQMIERQNYQRLLMGTVRANELDKKALYNDYVATSQIAYAYHPYGQLPEDQYPVTDAELKNEYDNVKGRFKVDEPTKDVSFIAVTITPSAADRKASSDLANRTLAQLNDSNGNDKALRKEGVTFEHRQLRAADIKAPAVRNYITSTSSDTVSMIYNNMSGFKAVRLNNRRQAVDSVTVTIVQVLGEQLPTRVMTALNNGSVSIDSISSRFGADSIFVQKEQVLALFNADGPTRAIEQGQLDTLRQAGGRYVSLMTSPQGAVLAKLVKQSAPVAIYDFDEITYNLKPSAATITEETEKLEKFLAENNTPAKFAENAPKSGYNVQDLTFTQSSSAVPRMMGMQQYLPDSRQVVRWVMIDGKPGQVSRVYESKDANAPALYAVAVNSAYDDYAPLSNANVKNFVTQRVRRAKAGDKLMNDYQGKTSTIENAAQAMGVEPQSSDVFRFGRQGQVRDAKAMGRINGSKADNKVVLVKGDDGIYAFVVNGNSKEDFKYDDATYQRQYQQLFQPNMEQMLRGSKKLENNVYKFEAGD
ncbi:MAG: hypothetical protein K2H75_07870, partial [Muribaculaceae bacterium]|nr:hypothetical protein [Muribaculaceae bacterium]